MVTLLEKTEGSFSSTQILSNSHHMSYCQESKSQKIYTH